MNPGNVRKKLLVKVFAGPIWEGKLLKFVGVFTERRDQFEFELTLHTAVGVDVVNLKLNIVDQRTAEVSQKYVISPCVSSVEV